MRKCYSCTTLNTNSAVYGSRWEPNGTPVAEVFDVIDPVPETRRIYLAGSLRNQSIPELHLRLKKQTGWDVFSDWFAAGPEADDYWKRYYTDRGFNYQDALREPASVNTFLFDKRNIDNSDVMVLALPAGKSGHLELGYHLGKGKAGYILLDDPERWDVMYQFATGVTDDFEELCKWIKELK